MADLLCALCMHVPVSDNPDITADTVIAGTAVCEPHASYVQDVAFALLVGRLRTDHRAREAAHTGLTTEDVHLPKGGEPDGWPYD